ncbi:unnamed protein product [Heterobilharzia americana]|nr:unnamed protein product [Heterobilharzia americana]
MSENRTTSESSSFSTLPHIMHSIPHVSLMRKGKKCWVKQSNDTKCENSDDDDNVDDEVGEEEGEHTTDIILTFVLAVDPQILLNKEPVVVTRPKSFNSRSSSSSQGHNNFMYFHIEYSILNSDDYLFSTDVVIFTKSIAKIYPTNCSSKLTSPCEFNDTLWIVWTEQIPIMVTDETIIDFWNLTQNGGIRIKCWDQRDKCSIQTRFDRPRSVSVKNTNMNQMRENSIDKMNLNDIQSTIDILSTYCKTSMNIKLESETIELLHQKREPTLQSQRKIRLMSGNTPLHTVSSIAKLKYNDQGLLKTNRLREDLVNYWGSCCLVLQSGHLFRINPPKWIVARKPSTNFIYTSSNVPPLSSVVLNLDNSFKDILVGMRLTSSLMSSYQRRKFKPIILTIDKLRNLPVIPYRSYEEMRDICEPARLITNFSNVWNHQSQEYAQDKEIYMNEVQVILTNNIPRSYLRELIQTTPMVIDLYDRVRAVNKKTETKQNNVGSLFCTEPDDDKIGEVQPNLRTDTLSMERIKQKNDKVGTILTASPTGRIKVNLSELVWSKCVTMRQKLPVLPISESDLDLLESRRSIDRNPRHISRDYIGYVDWQCELSIEIEPEKNKSDNCFTEIIEKIKLFVLKSNARSLGISDELPLYILQANLNSRQSQYIPCIHSRPSSSIAMNSNNSNGKRNDENFQIKNEFITGFHLNDEDFDLIILETGDSEVSKRLEDLFNQILNMLNVRSKFQSNYAKYLKNSGLAFTKRLYTPLNWYLLENIMTVPMRQLTEHSILHIRDLLPRLAYCAIDKIMNLRLHCQTLSNSVRADLFPNCEMIQALVKQFCISSLLTNLKSSLTNFSVKSMPSLVVMNGEHEGQQKSTNKNEDVKVMESLSRIKSRRLSKSCSVVDRFSKQNLSKDRYFYHSLVFDKTCDLSKQSVYNYSIQSLNSSIISKNELYHNILSKKERYTYSNEYLHSGSFEITYDDCYNDAINKRLTSRSKCSLKSLSSNSSTFKRCKQWNESTNLTSKTSQHVSFKAKLCREITENEKTIK